MTVITLCGSVRFKGTFLDVAKQLTLNNIIVLKPEVFDMHMELHTTKLELKKELDETHFRKIDLSDAIYVINLFGYIGESTTNEINYAKAQGKAVFYLNDGFDASSLHDLVSIHKKSMKGIRKPGVTSG